YDRAKMTGKLVNLRQKRKQTERETKRKAADQNAALHGRTKAEKNLQQTQALQAARALDGVKRDG
ncbi:MAG: DUF4169 family protein, partial [Methylococcales bacterium]|nr:DUF4169 family protein [Methylococcales bacterium]